MHTPFIRNHEYNFIKKQAELIQHAIRTNADPKVLESVRYSAATKLEELFPNANDEQKHLLAGLSSLTAAEDFQKYLKALEPYLLEFPHITEKQIQKLFPKNKKLKLPDLDLLDRRYVTYIGWTDISTNKLFMVYHVNGQFAGVEGRFTPTHKKSYCFVCNRYEELVLFSAVSKRPPKASADYYKSVGNYLCMNGHECNANITDVTALEKFIDSVIR